jgi:integrase
MAGKLTVRGAAAAKPGRHGDGDGLWLEVSTIGKRRWVFRFSFAKRVTELSLGPAATMTLAEARTAAHDARKLVAAGKNPGVERRKAKEPSPAKQTFGQCAAELLQSKESQWKNAKHRQQWHMTLNTYCAPIWNAPVEAIDTEAVLAVLQPLWLLVPETAQRLRGRIEAVLDAARVRGRVQRNEANPARWKGHLDKLLPRVQKLTRGHHAAMPYADVPAFLAALRNREAIAALALEFAILTAARTGEVLGSRWNEIDFDLKVWIIPATRMKAGREHRVPLAGRALAILGRLAEARTGEIVFPGQRAGKPLSNMSLEMVLRRMKIEGATVHGFRASFKDWASDETHFARETIEAALAHAIGDKAEQAYRRSDALEKRRTLMDAWAAYLVGDVVSNVIPLARHVEKASA